MNNNSSQVISSERNVATSGRRQLLPGPRVTIVLAVCVVGILATRRLPIDLAAVNLLTIFLIGIACVCLLLWFVVCSSYPLLVRWGGTALLIGLGATLLLAFRVERVTGALIPKIVPRWSRSPDELLAQPKPAGPAAVIDLSVVTEHDFPQFLGPLRRSEINSVRLSPDWQINPPQEVWRRAIGAGWSGFAAVNGYAVTMEQRGDSELVTCYEIATGDLKWSNTALTRHSSALGYVGPRSTPTIHKGRVYALGATGILRCLDGANGRLVWNRDLFAEYGFTQEEAQRGVVWGRSNSPLVVRDAQLIVPVGGPADGPWVSLAALDLDTGQTLWESGGTQVSYSSPIVATLRGVEQIVSVNEANVSGYEIESGELLWEHSWPGSSRATANVSQPMVIDGSHVLLTKGYGRGAELVEVRRNDNRTWSTEVAWSNARVLKTKFSNVAVHDGFAYGLDDGILCCIKVETGERVWKKGRYQYGQILLVNDLLLVMSEGGELALVRASPAGFAELGRIKALSDQAWNTLCLWGPYLLVRNSEEAACFELAVEQL